MKNTNAQSFSKQLPKQDVVFLFCLPCWGKRRKEEKKKRKKKKEKRKKKKPAHHQAAITDLLDEGVAGAVVRDGETKCGALLEDVGTLALAAHVGKEKVVEANLAAQEAGHVDFVSVEGNVKNLRCCWGQ